MRSFFRMQSGLSLIVRKEFTLLLLRQGSHTEGATTMMELDYLEIAESSVWPPLRVVPVGMLSGYLWIIYTASTSDLLSTWIFKSSVIILSYRIMAMLSMYLGHIQTVTQIWPIFMLQPAFSKYVYFSVDLDLLTVTASLDFHSM